MTQLNTVIAQRPSIRLMLIDLCMKLARARWPHTWRAEVMAEGGKVTVRLTTSSQITEADGVLMIDGKRYEPNQLESLLN